MANELARLVVRLEADVSDLKRELGRTEDRMDRVRRSGLSVQKAMAAMAGAAGFAYAAKKAFELGASVEETASKFRTVFGASSDEVQQFIDDFASMAGLSQQQAQEITATTGAIVQGMGYAQNASADFAQAIVRLAGDLSSFNNIPIAETSRAIQAALTGEREQLKRLGIVVREADVQQRALAMSGKEAAAALTQQEKAAATLELISERAGVAIGDLARTQDSAANRARRLTAELKSAAEAVSAALLPAFEQLLGELLSGDTGIVGLAAEIRANADVIAAWAKVTVRAVMAVIAPFKTLIRLAFNLGQVIGESGRAWAAVLRGDFGKAAEIAGEAKRHFGDMADALDDNKEAWEKLLDSVGEAATTMPNTDDRIVETTQNLRAMEEAAEGVARAFVEIGKAMPALEIGRRTMAPGIERLGPGGFSDFDITPQAATGEAQKSFSELMGAVDNVSRSAIGLADNLGLVDGASRDAARGISDLIGGLAAGGVAGGFGIVAGIVGIVNALTDDSKARAIEAARLRFEDVLDDYVDELGSPDRFQRLERQAREGAEAAFRALVETFVTELPRQLQDEARQAFEELFRSGRSFDEIARIMEDLFGADAQRVLDAYRQHMEEIQRQRQEEIRTMRQSLQLRLLEARGMDEQAARMRMEIEHRQLLADAILSGDLAIQALVVQLIAAEQAAFEAAKAEREKAKAEREAAQAVDFYNQLAMEQARLVGDDLRIQMLQGEAAIRSMVAQFRALVEAGVITAAELKQLEGTMRENLKRSLEEAARAAREAAEAERFRAAMDKEMLRVEILRAKGMDDAAKALERGIRLQRALQQGRDDEYIALLKQLFAAEDLKRATENATDGVRSLTRELDGMTRVLNAPAGFNIERLRFQAFNPLTGGSSVVNAGNNTFNVYAAPGQSAEEIASAVRREWERSARAGLDPNVYREA